MLRCWLRLHAVLGDLFQSHRISITPGFALCHRFAKDYGADEDLRMLDKDCEDTRFVCFNEPIGIADNFHIGNWAFDHRRRPLSATRRYAARSPSNAMISLVV